jgi:hypothetical protein
MKSIKILPAAALACAIALAGCNKKEEKTEFSIPDGVSHKAEIALSDAPFASGKTLRLTHGIGSGAFRLASDPEGVIYTISDRGPNIDCKDDEKLIGADMCQSGKIFPTPDFTPSIYKYKITSESAELLERITLKNDKGHDITGLPNPFVTTDTEQAFDTNATPIPYDPSGVDTEGIVKLSDGTFWLADEYGPSIIHAASDGKIIERLVPAGLEKDLAGAEYKVSGTLPAILMKRKLNRGIESIGVSPDEKYLFFAMQSPLANPNNSAYKRSDLVRIFKMELHDQELVGEYVYKMEKPEVYVKDNENKAQKQSDVKVSEMVGLGSDEVIILERISKSTRLYKVEMEDADNILGTKWDSMQTTETLELQSDTDIKTVEKELIFDSDKLAGIPEKVEGVALIKNGKAVIVNDNDFGIANAETVFYVISLPIH